MKKANHKEVICIVAFQDHRERSVSYRQFTTIEGAVRFYEDMLSRDYVKVISTRKVTKP